VTQSENTFALQARAEGPFRSAQCLQQSCMSLVRESNGRRCRNRNSVLVARFTHTSWHGHVLVYLNASGPQALSSMRKWGESLGCGKILMEALIRLRWLRSPSGRTRRIGEKMGTKRSVFVDGRGVPLSVVVSGANTHDSRLLGVTLDQRMLDPPNEGNNLCLDAGYVGKADMVTERKMIPQIRPRSDERRHGRGRKNPVDGG
jgi:hypothetical protein